MKIYSVSIQQVISDMERDLLFHIISNMRKMELSVNEASSIAKEFLGLVPVEDTEVLLKKLHKLGESHKEIRAVFIIYGKAYDEEKRSYVLGSMRRYLSIGDITKAVTAAKGEAIYG